MDNADLIASRPDRRDWVLAIAYCLVILDSLCAYLLHHWLGLSWPVNALLLAMATLLLAIARVRFTSIPIGAAMAVALIFLGISFGLISLDQNLSLEVRKYVSAGVAFVIGVLVAAEISPIAFRRGLLVVASVYVFVCTVALVHLLPGLFPVTHKLINFWGELYDRPEITADQNIQILYLFFAASLLSVRQTRLEVLWNGLVLAGAAYVVAEIQTRSGFLVLLAMMALALLAGAFRDRRLVARALILPGVAAALVLWQLDALLDVGSNLVRRFANNDWHTLDARVYANAYLLERLPQIHWWWPRGYEEYLSASKGTIPHSNFTALFLEGGILALGGWLAIAVVPVVRLTRYWKSNSDDDVARIILVSCAGLLVLQLSLNIATAEQVWLWTGAAVGAVERVRQRGFRREPLGPSEA